MSFFRKLFGGGEEHIDGGDPIEHKGYTIRATPYSEGGQYQVCGVISKEIGGEAREHRFVRADRCTSLDEAIAVSLRKGKQIADELGDSVFS